MPNKNHKISLKRDLFHYLLKYKEEEKENLLSKLDKNLVDRIMMDLVEKYQTWRDFNQYDQIIAKRYLTILLKKIKKNKKI